jgi:hypothetical protein
MSGVSADLVKREKSIFISFAMSHLPLAWSRDVRHAPHRPMQYLPWQSGGGGIALPTMNGGFGLLSGSRGTSGLKCQCPGSISPAPVKREKLNILAMADYLSLRYVVVIACPGRHWMT